MRRIDGVLPLMFCYSGTGARTGYSKAAEMEFAFTDEQQMIAETARTFLAERGFDLAAAAHFGCGYAPEGWDKLVKALTSL